VGSLYNVSSSCGMTFRNPTINSAVRRVNFLRRPKTLLAIVPPSNRAICKVWCRNTFSLRDMTIGKGHTGLKAMTKLSWPQNHSVGSYYIFVIYLLPKIINMSIMVMERITTFRRSVEIIPDFNFISSTL